MIKKTASHLKSGEIFGSLLANDILKLDVFKHVPFMGGLNTEGMLFMEILLFQLFLTVAKKSEKKLKMDEMEISV